MNISRITIDILSGKTNRYISPKTMGSLLRYHEDVILHHLKKKTNFGGYGYFHTRLYDNQVGENFVKGYGQILEVHLKDVPIVVDSLIKLSDLEKLNVLLDYTEKSVRLAEMELKMDGAEILLAIRKARETGMDLKGKYDDWWKKHLK